MGFYSHIRAALVHARGRWVSTPHRHDVHPTFAVGDQGMSTAPLPYVRIAFAVLFVVLLATVVFIPYAVRQRMSSAPAATPPAVSADDRTEAGSSVTQSDDALEILKLFGETLPGQKPTGSSRAQ